MTDLATARDSLLQCYDAIEDLGGRMTAPDWQVQSLCPDWKSRDVVQHLAMMERVMAGWVPDSSDEVPDFGRVAHFTEEMAGLDDAAFAGQVAEIFAVRRGDLAKLTQDDIDRPSWTPVGVKTFGRFLEIRVFDFWVHERDITTPLGWPTDDSGPRAEISLAEVTGSLGYIVGKRIGLPDGSSIVFHLTGPLARDLSVVVARPGQARRSRRSPGRRGDHGHADVHAARVRAHRPARADRRRPDHLVRERGAGRSGGPQPAVHDVSTAASPSPTRVTLLGTGSPLPTAQHAGPATLVHAGDAVLLVDCGRAVVGRVAGVGRLCGARAPGQETRNERRGKASPKSRPGG